MRSRSFFVCRLSYPASRLSTFAACLSLGVIVSALGGSARAQETVLTDDAHVSTTAPNSSDGAAQIMRVRAGVDRAFLKFSVNPALFPSGTVGMFVGKATLKVFVNTVNVPGTLQVAPAASVPAWSEAALTNNNAPPLRTATAVATVTTGEKWVTFDVTSLVQQWIDTPASNNGIALVAAGTTDVEIDSKEDIPFILGGGLVLSGHPAQLEITLNHAGTADAATLAANATNLGGAPASSYVQSDSPLLNGPRTPLPGSPSYIQNTTLQQPLANFNISGNGTLGGMLSADTLNANRQFFLGGVHFISTGFQSTFVGAQAGVLNAGSFNTFLGTFAGKSNTTGTANTFFGDTAGENNTTAFRNSYFGSGAGALGTTGEDNSSFGYHAGLNSNAFFNSFFGSSAGSNNTTGSDNTFIGYATGTNNTSGLSNTFVGGESGFANTTGSGNNFFGIESGGLNTTGSSNSFFGNFAGELNTTGNNNVFLGAGAGNSNDDGQNNVFVGGLSAPTNKSGSNNTVIGAAADVGIENLTYATAIGAGAVVSASNTITLGRASGADTVQIPGTLSTNTFSANTINANSQFDLGGTRLLSANSGLLNTAVGGGLVATGANNSLFGTRSGLSITTGNANSFFGDTAGQFNGTGSRNSFYGSAAGFSNTSGTDNSFVGFSAGMSSNASFNSFYGSISGVFNTDGTSNSFFGFASGRSNTSGFRNSYFGSAAGDAGANGSDNSFFGANAGTKNTAGENSFFGALSGGGNTTGTFNSYFGESSGFSNLEGSYNSFFGAGAGFANTATSNSFFGADAGVANTVGTNNSFFGRSAGQGNTTGFSNSFFGFDAGTSNNEGTDNAFYGFNSGAFNVNGSRNSFFGTDAGFGAVSDGNSFFGWVAGSGTGTGSGNSTFGELAGSDAPYGDGYGNVFVGGGAAGGNFNFFHTPPDLSHPSSRNTFLGVTTGLGNTTGSNNTLLGSSADLGANNLIFATAIGAGSIASTSNSITLGRNTGLDTVQIPGFTGIGTLVPTSPLTVVGLIETDSAAGGIKFPDGSVQKSAAISGNVVKTLNGFSNDVVLAAGSNVTITPAGNTLTISATGGSSGNAILNQLALQSPASFNISGTGKAGIFDALTQYNLAGAKVLSIPGQDNLFIGAGAGSVPDPSGDNIENVFVGTQSGPRTTECCNAFFGNYTGKNNTTGQVNTFLGYQAGVANIQGSNNTFVGSNAGALHTAGDGNTFIGDIAGVADVTGLNNTFVGRGTGGQSALTGPHPGTPGAYNTFLGTNATATQPANLTYATAIGAGSVVDDNNKIVLGRTTDLVSVPGTFTNPSDIRLKNRIANLNYGLNEILHLRPVSWTWKNDPNERIQMGLIAQEVRPLVPEVVLEGSGKDHLLSMNYIGLLPIVIRAIQEQQQTIDDLRQQLTERRLLGVQTISQTSLRSPSPKTTAIDGTISTDQHGEAVIPLPAGFDSTHNDFRYQLTVVGQFAQAIIAAEIKNNTFTIKTDKPNVKVSWQVTAQDAAQFAAEGVLVTRNQ